jgi:hypothetical protein
MEIDTEYAANLFFPNSAFVQVYFEAVANAFDAEASEIEIKISTDGNISPEYLTIVVSDNGIGFTDTRFERFRKLTEPCDPYHKGLGRLVYLHYFRFVHIESIFSKANKRVFTFSRQFDGKSELTVASTGENKGTVIQFNSFLGGRLKKYDNLKPGYLKNALIEQFLPLLYNKKKAGEEFRISLELETETSNKQKEFFPDHQTITPNDIPDFECETFNDPQLGAFREISMSYILRQGLGEQAQFTAACVDGRTIPIKLLKPNSIPVNHSAIFLFESDLFAGKSDSSRQKLILPDTVPEGVLYKALRDKMSHVLNRKIPEIEKRNNRTRQKFEKRYPHLIGLFEEDTVGLIDKNDALEIAQSRFFKKQKEVLEGGALNENSFQKSLEVSSRTLTEYILYREIIIDSLRNMSDEDSEVAIHNLIVPRYKSFHKGKLIDEIYSNNAWLLDDKFMSFRTILSEAKMQDVIKAITLQEDVVQDEGRPDISMIFSADPESEEKVDVVVVELKRRKVDDKENPYAATQLVTRAQKLADHCPAIQRVWYFGIIEIDDSLSQLLQNMRWTPLFSKGKLFYQDFQVTRADGAIVPTPTYLISYDAIIEDAAARNHTFLELLRNGFRRVCKNQPLDNSTPSNVYPIAN